MGFLDSLFTGNNPTLNENIGTTGTIGGYGTSTGMGDTSAVSKYLQSIIGGDPASISRTLAPQIGQIAKQANEKIQTQGEFGNRSGGVNASNESTMDTSRGNIDDLIAKITSGGVGALGDLGTKLLGMGLSAEQVQAMLSQERMKNQQNSILGGAIAGGSSALLNAGIGALGI